MHITMSTADDGLVDVFMRDCPRCRGEHSWRVKPWHHMATLDCPSTKRAVLKTDGVTLTTPAGSRDDAGEPK